MAEKTRVDLNDLFDRMAENWLSEVVARKKMNDFSGGSVSPKMLANHDWAGTGPKGRIKIGKNVAYPKHSLIEWLKRITEAV